MLTIHKALITTFAALTLSAVVPMSAQATPLGATHSIGRPDGVVEQARAGRGGGGGGPAAAAATAVAAPIAAGPPSAAGPSIAAGPPIVAEPSFAAGPSTAAGPSSAAGPPSAAAAGPGRGRADTGGRGAARSQPVQPSASSRRRQRRHGPVLPRRPTCAGTTPMRAGRRVSGTTASDALELRRSVSGSGLHVVGRREMQRRDVAPATSKLRRPR